MVSGFSLTCANTDHLDDRRSRHFEFPNVEKAFKVLQRMMELCRVRNELTSPWSTESPIPEPGPSATESLPQGPPESAHRHLRSVHSI